VCDYVVLADTQKFFEVRFEKVRDGDAIFGLVFLTLSLPLAQQVFQEGHLIWALPLTIVLVTICLVLIMGPTTLVGIAVLVMFVPVVERVTSSMLAIRQMRVKMTDKRIGIVSSMLRGVSFADCVWWA
jgi:hypothetical protein